MTHQLVSIVNVLRSPRQAFEGLPSDRWYALAWLAPIYFGSSRALRDPENVRRFVPLGGKWGLLLFAVVIAAIVLPVSGWLLKLVLRLFGKRLTVRKIMNIWGYALVPRLLAAAVGFVVLWTFPTALTLGDGPNWLLLALVALGIIAMLWTLVLFIYGIVVSPGGT